MSLRIALDYDNTYSADPALWQAFILHARNRGHEVRIVTARAEHLDKTDGLINLENNGVEIIWCWGVAKRFHCERVGWMPDIWIDDKPEAVYENSTFSPEALAKWREERTC